MTGLLIFIFFAIAGMFSWSICTLILIEKEMEQIRKELIKISISDEHKIGCWIYNRDIPVVGFAEYECSECGRTITDKVDRENILHKYQYCPNCGTKMEGVRYS